MTEGRSPIGAVALASLIGTTIEWYDFFLYGTAAALVFNRLFFPNVDPLLGTLAAFATYAVGFVARPVGGIVIGHDGDRIGRRSMLVLTLVIMEVATFIIGLLPTDDQIGLFAAVALVILRIAQGFGVGGEWGGAVLMAVEHAPPGRRGFYGSWPQVGVPAGLLLSTAAFAAVSLLPESQFFAWGWRVPSSSSFAPSDGAWCWRWAPVSRIVMAVVTIVAVSLARETFRGALTDEPVQARGVRLPPSRTRRSLGGGG